MAKIHIALVGKDRKNVVKGLGIFGGSELFPIVSEKFKDEAFLELEKSLPYVKVHHSIGKRDLVIDPFLNDSYQDIVGLILDIAKKYESGSDQIFVNITGGTNLMSAAAMSGALLTHSSAFYVSESSNEILDLPWHSYNIEGLNDLDKDVIRILMDKEKCSDISIFNELKNKYFNKQKKTLSLRKIRYSLKKLGMNGYIKVEIDGRENRNSLTIWGKIAEKLI